MASGFAFDIRKKLPRRFGPNNFLNSQVWQAFGNLGHFGSFQFFFNPFRQYHENLGSCPSKFTVGPFTERSWTPANLPGEIHHKNILDRNDKDMSLLCHFEKF